MAKTKTPAKKISVCALGASAGGLAALRTFFECVRPDLGYAYVVVMHLAPDHTSALDQILAAVTKMPVEAVTGTAQLRPNHIYVIPPDRQLTVTGAAVREEPFIEARGHRDPINGLFKSIATNHKDGFGILLSGEGMDGTAGALELKASGGTIFAQDPIEAEHSSMPQAAIAAGIVDIIAPVAALAKTLEDVTLSEKMPITNHNAEKQEESLLTIISILRRSVGHDFSHYKRATVLRRIARRMQLNMFQSMADYASFLQASETEADALFSALLISVTSFFRDPRAFEALSQNVILPLFDRIESQELPGIRAWSVGCATGEEAYSLAMLLIEEAERRKIDVPIQIFATDIDAVGLAHARRGVYDCTIEANLTEARLTRFFVREGEHWRVHQELRDMILFAQHSVLKNPPFLHLNIVTCRNLLIYLDRETQRHVYSVLRYALDPVGALMLGSAETVAIAADAFQTVDRESRIYIATPGWGQASTTFEAMASHGKEDTKVALSKSKRPDRSIGVQHLEALENTAPPSVIVGSDLRVLHLSPRAGRFLMPPGGPLSQDLPSLARPELRADLTFALQRAFDTGQAWLTKPVIVAFDDINRRVSVQVSPATGAKGEVPKVIVFFLDGGVEAEGEPASESADRSDIRQMQDELRATRYRLVTSLSEHELSKQELRAANEELQSIDEEYRSTSEELETSKEELQSMNEELQTLNAELRSNIDGISSAHSDLRNIVDASDFGTLFLDTELKIRMYTPQVKEVFNLVESDIGRPITDFAHKFNEGGAADHATAVLRDLVPLEIEERTEDGRWFAVRFRPYRTIDDRIDGVVVTFIDVTNARLASEAVRTSEQRFATLLTAANDSAFRARPDWSELLMIQTGAFLADADGLPSNWLTQYLPKDQHPRMMAAIEEAIANKSLFELEHRVFCNDGSVGWSLTRAAPMLAADGSIREWFGIASNVTARKEKGEQAQSLLAELNHRVKNMLTVILSIAEQTREDSSSLDAFAEAFENRVFSLVQAHDALTQTGWKGADLGDLTSRAVELFSSVQRKSVTISGPVVKLGPNATTGLSLGLHELSTNAVKHGSLSVPEGRVDIVWKIDEPDDVEEKRLVFDWKESGGPPVILPARRGFGSKLLEQSLPSDLSGSAQMTFAPGGLCYRLEAPYKDWVQDD